MARQPKAVNIIARYIHKTDGRPNGTVTYLVRASNGVDTYCTTIINGEASGCSCPSKAKCYHKKQLEQKEQERWAEYRRELAKKLAAQFVTTQVVEQLVRIPEREVILVRQLVEYTPPAYRQPAKTTDVSRKGNLNGTRAFSIMR